MILISAWSRGLVDGRQSPKNYPHWDAVAAALKPNYPVVQLACKAEPDVAGAERVDDLPLQEIAVLIRKCDTWIAPDNFFPHFAWTLGEPGVAIFGQSDPEIFGHPENINLLQDRRHLRTWQFRHWIQVVHDPKTFVGPSVAVAAAMLSIQRRRSRKSS